MTKKIFLGMSAMAMLFATSCQDDMNLPGNVGETTTVAFNVSTPEIGTRAYSDGQTATVLQYAVYDAQGNILPQLKKMDATIDIKANVELELTTGDTYTVIFWAEAPYAPYNVDFEAKTMTVDYTDAVSNDENRDAFYAAHTFTVSGAQTENVQLRRPFAQLNIGTEDYQKATDAGYTPTKSAVTVKTLGNTLNLWDGTVSGNPEEVIVNFDYADIVKTEVFPVDDVKYDYLAMNYLLVGADQEVVDIEFGYTETDANAAKTRTVGSVPVRRNYRTNIYGKLLTSTVDVNVEIKPEYNEEDYLIYNVVVDGASYDDFATAAAKAMELNKPIELIQNVTIDADNTITVPAGKTLTLNLNGYTLKGVSDQTGSNRNIFDVRGEMTVDGANSMTRGAAVGNGVIAITHKGTNMGWGSSTNVFNVTASGVLNIRNTNAINFGGSDMAFVAHLNNWGEVTLNVENSTLESNYVAVRVFNSGYDMNNVTINNSTLKGGNYAFWVHNYTKEDFSGDQGKANAQKALLNFDIFNGTNTFEGKNDTPIRYGFTNSIYLDENGCLPVSEASDLQDALAAGQAVVLTNDIEINKIDLTSGTSDVVIDANGYTIKTSDSYGIEATAGKNITIKNAKIGINKDGNYITYAAGLKIANGDYAGKTIKLENCVIKMHNTDWAYAVNMPASVKNLNLVLDKCELEGAIAVQCWGDNNNIDITNSKLICNYTTSAQYTSYCVALQGDGTNNSENNKLTIANCEFSYSGVDNFNSPIRAVYVSAKATGNDVNVSNCAYGEKIVQ